jgi:hypothetical protein
MRTRSAGESVSFVRWPEMAQEAYTRSSIYAGLATVAGFALAVFLTSLE